MATSVASTELKKLVEGVARFALQGLLQNPVQINLQISRMALSREAAGELDGQLLFSVIMSVLISLAEFPTVFDIIRLPWRARGLLLDEGMDDMSDRKYREEVESLIRGLRWKLIRFCIYMFLYATMLGYTWLKIAGIFFCEHHLLNITGCVVM